jgi:hypothetical protein
MAAWKFLKLDVGDISKEYEAILKIVPSLAFGVYIRNWLVIHGLPADIITN